MNKEPFLECDEFYDNVFTSEKCNKIFISDEEILFSALRPYRDPTGKIKLNSWKEKFHIQMRQLKLDCLKQYSVDILYSIRSKKHWYLSSFAQNFDSHYWLNNIPFNDYVQAIEKYAPEIVSILDNVNKFSFEKELQKYGTPHQLPVLDILSYLREEGFFIGETKLSKSNSRKTMLNRKNFWITKPITIGQVLSKSARSITGFRCKFLNKMLTLPVFSHISVGHFLIDEDGNKAFKFSPKIINSIIDGQPTGQIT